MGELIRTDELRPEPSDDQPTGRWTSRVLTVVLILLAVAGLSLAFRPASLVIDEPITEDGYYALSVSRNVASGDGVTIDGTHATNGFQPLFTFAASVAFLLTPDDTTAIRLVLLMHWLIWMATAWLVADIVADWLGRNGPRRSTVRVVTALLFLGAAYIIHVSFNGLETGTVLLGYAALWRMMQVATIGRLRTDIALGVVAGLTVLARIDAAFMVVALCSYLLLVRRPRSAVTVGAVALAVSSPWWLYNYLEFGSLMPTSGHALFGFRPFSPRRLETTVSALGDVGLPWLFAGRFSGFRFGVMKLAALAALLLAGWMVPRRVAPDRTTCSGSARAYGWVFLTTCSTIVAWCFFTSNAVHFYYRYFAPVALLVIVIVAVVYGRCHDGWRRGAFVSGGFISGVIGIVAMAVLWNASLSEGNEWLNDQVPLVELTVPDGEVVAAGQSGTLGFWRADVVNLDGKVNPEVLERQDDMPAYLEEQSIRWLCDWPGYVESYLGERPADHGWELVAERGRFECWHRGHND